MLLSTLRTTYGFQTCSSLGYRKTFYIFSKNDEVESKHSLLDDISNYFFKSEEEKKVDEQGTTDIYKVN